METIFVPEQFAPKGQIIVRGYRAGAIARAQPLIDEFRHWKHLLPQLAEENRGWVRDGLKTLQRRIDEVFADYSLGIEVVSDNLIMTGSLTGRDLLVQYLIDGTIYAGISHGALGTSATAPAASDTQLTAEVARVAPSTAIDQSNNQAQFQFYFPDANLANNTYREAGTFMNGTASLNSGKIFNHGLLGSPFTKTSGVDTTLQVNITFT